jgi:large subunit ribosomal protein L32
MAVPKYKKSRASTRSRRANWKLKLPGINVCPQCHQPKLNHRVCKHCGFYDGRQAIVVKAEKEKAGG